MRMAASAACQALPSGPPAWAMVLLPPPPAPPTAAAARRTRSTALWLDERSSETAVMIAALPSVVAMRAAMPEPIDFSSYLGMGFSSFAGMSPTWRSRVLVPLMVSTLAAAVLSTSFFCNSAT